MPDLVDDVVGIDWQSLRLLNDVLPHLETVILTEGKNDLTISLSLLASVLDERKYPVLQVVVTHEVPTDWVEAHPDAPFHFVTEGVEAAVAKAQEIAGDRTVGVAAGTIAGQCLALGLLDAVAVDLVPVVMGQGRAYFGEQTFDDAVLADPTVCLQGDRVTHLVFPVGGSSAA